jgi:HSP20 family protein
MTLVRWTPAFTPSRDLITLQDDVNSFIDSFFRANGRRVTASPFTPLVDIEETPEEFVLRADLPGVPQKDVKVSLMGDTLTIRGERHEEKTEKSGTSLRVERNAGLFERSFTLGAPVRSDAVKATYRDGVLEIHVPKADQARLREIQIQTG